MNSLPTRPKWTTIAALLLVPLLVAGGFLWGTWNANPRLRSVQAAVVNLDEMVEVNGQKMPLGRQLAAELVDSEREQNLTWVLADEKHAQEGLASGAYAAVVTIPKEFSAAATSFSKEPDEAVQATIRVETSPVTGVSETAMGQYLATSASNALNRFLTGEYLKNIYVGFNEMGEQFTELKDGTRQLADGAGQLADGANQASQGMGQLADGLGQASAGSPQLRSGTQQLGDGLGTYAAGITEFDTGLQQYTDGVKQYVGTVNPLVTSVRDVVTELPEWGDLVATIDPIVGRLPEWADRLDALAPTYGAGLGDLLDRVDAYVASGTSASAAVDAYAGKLADTSIACPSDLADTEGGCEAFARGVAQTRASATTWLDALEQRADALVADGRTITTWTVRLRTAADQFATLAAEFRAWAPTAQQQWADLKAVLPNGTLTKADVLDLLDQFISGGTQLVDGSDQVADGSTQLASGAGQLADGAQQLASGINQYTAGIDQAASGARQLADGLVQLDDGSRQLADGTSELADGVAEGAGAIPSYTEDERTNLAKVVASPISTEGIDELVLPTVSWASLLLVMALWIGALAAYTVFRALDPRNLVSSEGNGRLLWRSLAPGLALVGAQGLALAALGAGVLGVDAAGAVGIALVASVAAVTFVLVNHALAAWFGTKGRVASLVFLLVTVVSAIAYSAPGALSALRPLSPLSPALDALRMVMTGHSATLPVLGLVAWLIAALGASWVAVARSRTVRLAALPA